jgi:hypothetical protein
VNDSRLEVESMSCCLFRSREREGSKREGVFFVELVMYQEVRNEMNFGMALVYTYYYNMPYV